MATKVSTGQKFCPELYSLLAASFSQLLCLQPYAPRCKVYTLLRSLCGPLLLHEATPKRNSKLAYRLW